MRTGGYTLQQSLTNEAATVVKQAVTLARRRGHAQVTPLHVASVMLASSNGLFRKACHQAHSHPFQCKALELCFNVALNRLPTTSSNSTSLITILSSPHHLHHLPSLSNALVAAFKRAQAHQRRGCLENQHQNQQQQPILALKVEIEQLVISILDDPSVSRVMREAGFSSPQVKSKVEQVTTSTAAAVAATVESKPLPPQLVLGNYVRPQERKQEKGVVTVRDDDVMSIVGAMMMDSKTKNTVIVGECTYAAESVVKGVIEKFDTGNVAGDVKHVQFISVPLYTLRNISREEFEEKLSELRSLVKSYLNNGTRGSGVVLYLGDLRWVSEFWSKYCEQRMVVSRSQYYNVYSPVEHMIMELSRLLSCAGAGGGGKIWIMGIATFNTYMKCKTGRPSLESLWDLHPLTIPVGSLSLTLTLDSDLNGNELMMRSKGGEVSNKARAEKYLTCCGDCLANFNKEATSLTTHSINGSSSLPSWLQKYKEEKQMETFEDDQELEKIKDLSKKWNSICKSIHHQTDHFLTTKIINKCSSPSPSPSSSASVSSSTDLNHHHHHHQSLLKLPTYYKEHNNKFFAFETKPDLLSNPNSSPNSASSSEASEDLTDLRLPHKFFEDNNIVNLKKEEAVCSALEKKVPGLEKELIREIVSKIFKCRSGKSNGKREDTWLSFLGPDSEGKDKIGRELAKAVFGSSKEGNFVNIGISAFSSSPRDDDVSVEEVISSSGSKNKKRPRDERGMSYFERFGVAIRENPSRLFFLEDFDQMDYHSRKRFKRAMESGNLSLPDNDELVFLKDAIIIFISSSEESVHRNSNGGDEYHHKMEEKRSNRTPLDLNVATEEDDEDENCVCMSGNGILNLVDSKIVFKK